MSDLDERLSATLHRREQRAPANPIANGAAIRKAARRQTASRLRTAAVIGIAATVSALALTGGLPRVDRSMAPPAGGGRPTTTVDANPGGVQGELLASIGSAAPDVTITLRREGISLLACYQVDGGAWGCSGVRGHVPAWMTLHLRHEVVYGLVPSNTARIDVSLDDGRTLRSQMVAASDVDGSRLPHLFAAHAPELFDGRLWKRAVTVTFFDATDRMIGTQKLAPGGQPTVQSEMPDKTEMIGGAQNAALDAKYAACVEDAGFDPGGVQVLLAETGPPWWVKTGRDVPADIHRPCFMLIGGEDPKASSYGYPER